MMNEPKYGSPERFDVEVFAFVREAQSQLVSAMEDTE
jgi:hypothetical protein